MARRECNNLHARLGGDRRAAYIAMTAYDWFCLRDNYDKSKVAELQAAQEAVERHLRDPAAPFEVPTDDVVCRSAKGVGDNIGKPLWTRL